MGAENWSAIAALASAAIAVAAAIAAKRSADRSAAAEERSAKAAEDAVAIERQRLTHELDDRAAATAPVIDIGAKHAVRWTLAQGGRALVGYIANQGPTGATIERITLQGPSGAVEMSATGDAADRFLDIDETWQLQAPWPFDGIPTEPLDITVIFAAATGSGYRAESRFTLRRAGSDHNHQPLWRSAESSTRRMREMD